MISVVGRKRNYFGGREQVSEFYMLLSFPGEGVLPAETPCDFCHRVYPQPMQVCTCALNAHFLYLQRPLRNHRNVFLFDLICSFSNRPMLTLAHSIFVRGHTLCSTVRHGSHRNPCHHQSPPALCSWYPSQTEVHCCFLFSPHLPGPHGAGMSAAPWSSVLRRDPTPVTSV